MPRRVQSAIIFDIKMMPGDNRDSAANIAQALGIDEFEAEVLPAGRLEIIRKLQAQGRVVAMAGDGINDAPVLAAADAGVAMGLASDAAIETADIVLLSDKLRSLPQAIRITRRVTRLARFNVAFALTVKALVFVLTVFGMATMWMAVFADVGVSILAVLNATRALRF